jgi:hypothetical protein
MVHENDGAIPRSRDRDFDNGSASPDERTDGVFRAGILAKLRPTALLVFAVAVMLSAGIVVVMELVSSNARARGAAAVAEPAGAVVAGRVRDPDRRPIAGARVVRGSDRAKAPFFETTTDAEGWFFLEDVTAGELILTAQAKGHAPKLRTLTIGQDRQSFDLWLGPGRCIRGRVVDVHNQPIAGAPVAVEEWRGHHSLKWSTETDAEGRFRWDEAPDGCVLISVGPLGDHPGKRYCRMNPQPAERTIVMREPLHIRGSAIDAETGQAITSFTLIPGYAWADGETPTWEYDRAQEVTGASYNITLDTIYPRHALRVRADGHLDGVSREFHAGEDSVDFVFKLRRGNWTEGVVRLSDRSPLAGAEVFLVSPSHPLFMHDEFLPGLRHLPPRIGEELLPHRTGAHGRFRFDRQEPPYTILVLHDRGCAEQTILVKPPAVFDLTIQPWGRIEGTLRIGKRPGAREKIYVFYDHHSDPPNAIPSWTRVVKTDDSGRFVFDRIKPGTAHVARVVEVKVSPDSWTRVTPTISTDIDVAPNATVRVNLGGTGRPVVGKLTAPAEIASRVNWFHTDNTLTAKPTPADRLSAAIPKPSGTSPGRSARIPYSVILDKDGSFRIEDVQAGTYDLNFVVLEPPRVPNDPPTDQAIATARREVTIPEMPGGRSDEPLDLGAIPLVPIEKR